MRGTTSTRKSVWRHRWTAFAGSDFQFSFFVDLGIGRSGYIPMSAYWMLRRGFLSDFATLWPCSAKNWMNISCASVRIDFEVGGGECSRQLGS